MGVCMLPWLLYVTFITGLTLIMLMSHLYVNINLVNVSPQSFMQISSLLQRAFLTFHGKQKIMLYLHWFMHYDIHRNQHFLLESPILITCRL